jgi:hypothetical protein
MSSTQTRELLDVGSPAVVPGDHVVDIDDVR